MSTLMVIFISAIFTNNFVLVQFLGLCPFMGVSKKLESALGLSCATTFVLTIASGISYILYKYILVPYELLFLRTIIFIVVIACTVSITEIMMKHISPLLYKVLGVFLPLITTNCIVLGVVILNTQDDSLSFFTATVQGFAAGCGFALALIIFACMRERLEILDVPQAFKGAPIALVTASIMSLAFMGFSGFTS